MKIKTYLAFIWVFIGGFENRVSLLLVANSDEAASALHKEATACYYGDADDEADSGGQFTTKDGQVRTAPAELKEIGLSTYLDLIGSLRVVRQANVRLPSDAMLTDLHTAANQLQRSLAAQGIEAPVSKVLHALSASWGAKNWNVLKAQLEAKEQLLAELATAASAVTTSADNTGCTDDLTVASAKAVEKLEEVVNKVKAASKK